MTLFRGSTVNFILIYQELRGSDVSQRAEQRGGGNGSDDEGGNIHSELPDSQSAFSENHNIGSSGGSTKRHANGVMERSLDGEQVRILRLSLISANIYSFINRFRI